MIERVFIRLCRMAITLFFYARSLVVERVQARYSTLRVGGRTQGVSWLNGRGREHAAAVARVLELTNQRALLLHGVP